MAFTSVKRKAEEGLNEEGGNLDPLAAVLRMDCRLEGEKPGDLLDLCWSDPGRGDGGLA